MHLKTLARRATALAAATLTMAGLMTVVTAPAHAGQVGVTISITGAGSVRVVEGTPSGGVSGTCDASENVADPAATKTCSRIRSEAPFEAWLWLRPQPAKDPTGRPWKISQSGWQGCDQTRVNAQVTECGVHSDAFGSAERYPSITFYDDANPYMSTVSLTPSITQDRSASLSFSPSERVNAHCRVDGGPWSGCTSPFDHTFAEDGEHEVEVQPVDLSGNAGPIYRKSVTLVDAVITEAPAALTSSATARFGFSTRGGTTFQCALDDANGASYCGDGPRTTHTLTGLSDGEHTLKVWADSPAGIDPVAATHTWVVDTVAPETTLTLAWTHADAARFEVSSSGSTSLECRLTHDGVAGVWTTCGPDLVTHVGLADGTYTQEVRGKDAAGNVDPTPASHTWTVDQVPDTPGEPDQPTDPPAQPSTPSPQPSTADTTAPDTTLTTAPAEGTIVTSERTTLGWSASEPATTTVCTLDGAPHACTGTTTELTGLTAGTHRFTVAAVDAAGNRDATPATRSWTVPITSRALKHGKGWTEKRSTVAYAGSYAVSRRRGAVLSTRVRGARSVALVATTGRGHGTVKVYAGKKLLRTVRLSGRTTASRTVLPVATLPAAWSGRIRIVVARAGKQVRIEGIGIAS